MILTYIFLNVNKNIHICRDKQDFRRFTPPRLTLVNNSLNYKIQRNQEEKEYLPTSFLSKYGKES